MSLIEIIYNETIKTFMYGLPNDDNIKNYYMDYIKKSYAEFDNGQITDKNKINILVELENNKWLNESPDYKKAFIIPDENLKRLSEISSFAYDMAKNRLKNDVMASDINLSEYLSKIEELKNKVYNFNIYLARELVSETILDLQYALGQTDDTSIRIGRIKENIPQKK